MKGLQFILILTLIDVPAVTNADFSFFPNSMLNEVLTVNQEMEPPKVTCTNSDSSSLQNDVPSWIHLTKDCPDVSVNKRNEFLNALSDAHDLAGLVASPPALNVDPCGGQGHFELTTNTLNFETFWENESGPMDVKYAKAVMVHEYGHAVLDSALNENPTYPAWGNFFKTSRTAMKKADEIEAKIRRTEKNLPLTKEAPSPDWDEIRKTHPELNQTYNDLTNALKMEQIRDAYSEFFADSLAIIYSKDPRVISAALTDNRHNERSTRIVNMRDFSHVPNQGEMSQWHKDIDLKNYESDGGFPYELLGPVRGALWDGIKDKINSSPEDRKQLVKKIFDALAGDFQVNFSSYDALQTFDPQKLVNRLSSKMRQLN